MYAMHYSDIFHLSESMPNPTPTYFKEDVPPSTWLVAPYFLIYFIMFIINTLVWPLQLMERACINGLPEDEADRITLQRHMYNQAGNSCISHYISGRNQTDNYDVLHANSETLNIMVIAAFGGGVVSILAYFLIWKPLLTKWRSVSLFVPPVCMLFQSLLLLHVESIPNYHTYKYTVLSSVMLPSLHCSFQGVFLLYFHMSEIPEVKAKREIMSTRLDGSHVVIFVSILISGCFIVGCFDLTYNLVFFFQFTLGSVNIMYAITLLPTDTPCMSGTEEDVDVKDGGVGEEKEEMKDDNSDEYSDSSTEELLLGDLAKRRNDGGLLTKQLNLLKEAPMIFSETSYKMELIVIIEVCVFTVAAIADVGISGIYFVQIAGPFDLRVFGGCIAAQGIIKIAGMFFIKTATRFTELKHASLICIAVVNYVIYYVALALVSTKVLVLAVMFTNVFGGLAIPTIFSYIKINFRETTEAVVEISMISSLLITLGYNALQYFLYEKTRNLYHGAVFILTAAVLVISAMIICATYVTTTKKNKRKSKYFADQLLSDKQ